MAKTQKYGGGKVKTRTVGGGRGKRPDFPANVAPSNPVADKQAQMIFIGLAAVSVLLVVGLLYWASTMIVTGWNHGHINWPPAVVGALMIGGTIFLARSLAWLSYFGAIMFAAKSNAFEAQERLCRSVLKRWKLFPGGGAMAGLILVQSLVSRGQFDEAITTGEQQYELHKDDPKFTETLAPMYSALGMAFQMKGDVKKSILWTERGIEAMQRTLEDMVQKKTWQAKLAGPQAAESAKQLRMQLGVSYFNNASCYFNQQNYRQSKQLYKQALDYMADSPDFPEKAEMMRVGKEQMQRLKHT